MSGMTTYIAEAVVDSSIKEVDGKTLTRPSLLVSDANSVMLYAVDVDIGQTRVNPANGEEEAAILKNVVIANGDHSVLYADIGAAVRVRRSSSGRWEVFGYSQRQPGTYVRLPIILGPPGAGPIPVTEYPATDISLTVRQLAYDELVDFGGYGVVPYGSYVVFRGETLVEIRS